MPEPMRVLDPGEWTDLSQIENMNNIKLKGPSDLWPGLFTLASLQYIGN